MSTQGILSPFFTNVSSYLVQVEILSTWFTWMIVEFLNLIPIQSFSKERVVPQERFY